MHCPSPRRLPSQILINQAKTHSVLSRLLLHPSASLPSPLALNELDDKRIKEIKPLIPPQILMEDLPLSLAAAQTIILGRQAAEEVIKGRDDRLLVVVGPCSIHDPKAAIEYGMLPGGTSFVHAFFH